MWSDMLRAPFLAGLLLGMLVSLAVVYGGGIHPDKASADRMAARIAEPLVTFE